jgi:hypothetical protein
MNLPGQTKMLCDLSASPMVECSEYREIVTVTMLEGGLHSLQKLGMIWRSGAPQANLIEMSTLGH